MNLYCFDGSHLAFRAHCAYPALTLGDLGVGATYGTIRILQTFVSEFQPGKIVMPFDLAKSKHRVAMYPEYKASKARLDSSTKLLKEQYQVQLPALIELLNKFGITTLSTETAGIEADDVIAYLVHRFNRGDFSNVTKVIIITSDKDLCALVGPKVVWYDPIKKDLITDQTFKERFGIEINQYADYKALKGDKSDNIPHPRGIGPTNAVELLTTYGSVEKLLEVKHHKIEPFREVVLQALKLVSLNLHELYSNDPVWKRIDEAIYKPTQLDVNIEELLADLQFNSILEDWGTLKPKWLAFAQATLFAQENPWS